MDYFLDSPTTTLKSVEAKRVSLIEILNTPSKETKSKANSFKSKDNDISNSSTTMDEKSEVSFENGKNKKLIQKKPKQKR